MRKETSSDLVQAIVNVLALSSGVHATDYFVADVTLLFNRACVRTYGGKRIGLKFIWYKLRITFFFLFKINQQRTPVFSFSRLNLSYPT